MAKPGLEGMAEEMNRREAAVEALEGAPDALENELRMHRRSDLPTADGGGHGPGPDRDPWAHRSLGMRCVTCMYYVPKADTKGKLGRCRRHAPTMNGYPVVFPLDWCGDHKLEGPTPK